MKRSLIRGLVPLMAVAVMVLSAKQSNAVAAPSQCFQDAERLGLTPTGAVTLDGFILQRSTTDGRFHTDGGLDFDVSTSEVLAVELIAEACTAAASTVTLTVTDPFTGVRSVVGAVAP